MRLGGPQLTPDVQGLKHEDTKGTEGFVDTSISEIKWARSTNVLLIEVRLVE
jgi:hypothetical protein